LLDDHAQVNQRFNRALIPVGLGDIRHLNHSFTV
jgi:hypothetical protein